LLEQVGFNEELPLLLWRQEVGPKHLCCACNYFVLGLVNYFWFGYFYARLFVEPVLEFVEGSIEIRSGLDGSVLFDPE